MPNRDSLLIKPARRRFYRPFARFIVLLSAVFSILCVYLASGPDRDLHFSREIPSQLEPARIDRNFSAMTRWPQWFFSLSEVQVLNSENVADKTLPQVLKPGETLQLDIDPHKGKSKRFQIRAEVTKYSPGQSLSLKILQDSSHRLTRLFDQIEWTLEIKPHGHGSLLRGTATAHTSHWRSRLLGYFAEKIIMNQIFYPDLIKLSELRQPFSDLSPRVVPGSGSMSD